MLKNNICLSDIAPEQLLFTNYRLPDIIQRGLNVMERDTEKSVFVLSAIVSMSAVMPNVVISFNGEHLRPNIYVNIVGSSGTGKNAIKLGRDLVEPYDKVLIKERDDAIADARARAQQEKEGDPIKNIKDRFLIVPEAITAPALFAKLRDNQYFTLLMFAEEAKELKRSLKSEHGGFESIILKLKETGKFSKAIKAELFKQHAEDVFLSLILSSTRQDIDTLGDTVNGLFNRFLWYVLPELLPDDYKIKRTPINKATDKRTAFKQASTNYKTLTIGYDLVDVIKGFLEGYTNAVNKADYATPKEKHHAILDSVHVFHFTDAQETELEEHTRQLLADFDGDDLNGLKVRLNNDVAKVAATLTFCDKLHLRQPAIVECPNHYFETAKYIVYTCFEHARVLFHYQNKSERLTQISDSHTAKIEKFERLILSDVNISYKAKDLEGFAKKCGISDRTLYRWLKSGKVKVLQYDKTSELYTKGAAESVKKPQLKVAL